MKNILATFNTDAVNRQNIMVPLKAMVLSVEKSVLEASTNKLPSGLPSYVSHDLHRLIGWSNTLGFHISSNLSRQIGVISLAENEEERKKLLEDAATFERYSEIKHLNPYLDLLKEISIGQEDVEFRFYGAAFCEQVGIAKTVYPKLFFGSEHVDKDGLVDLDYLLSEFEEVQPGVYKDRHKNTILFAHRYFRRSLSTKTILMYIFCKIYFVSTIIIKILL